MQSTDGVGSRGAVEVAIQRAASATGVDFGFLMRTARRESALNPSAKAPTSSAAGLFQFVEQTWLGTLKQHGAALGLQRYADQIAKGSDGRYHVADPATRRSVLDLRYDPHAASLMAGAMTADHAAYLRGRTGREPTSADLYAAHFLGPEGSARLIAAADTRPGASAAAMFPDAANANRSIFYRDGRAATVSEVYANLSRDTGRGGVVAAAPSAEGAADLDEHSAALARRLDRIEHERTLLSLMMGDGQDGTPAGGSLISTQLLGAFAPPQSGDS